MTGSAVATRAAATTGTRWISPQQLAVGDEVIVSDFLPSDEGYRHVVDAVADESSGFVRVWFDVYDPDGGRRRTALRGRPHFRWDRLYDLVPPTVFSHLSGCGCGRCVVARQNVTMVEVVA